MKKRLTSWLLAAAMLLGMLPAMALPAAAASSPTVAKLTAGQELKDNTIYLVTEDTTITAANDQNGLKVAAGAKTVLYIASGVKLIVHGGHASSNTVGGKAGILLPQNSTLTVTGGGLLLVTGGDGAKAGDGGNGSVGNGLIAGPGFGSLTSVTFWGGAGGSGGHGASGGGAAIGTDGGAGGAGGAGAPGGSSGNDKGSSAFIWGTSQSGDINTINSHRDPVAGGDGGNGSTASQMGTLYVVGGVTVSAAAGDGGSAGKAGTVPTIKQSPGWVYSDPDDVKQSDKNNHTAGALIRFDLGGRSATSNKKNPGYATFCLGPGGAGGGGAGGKGAAIGTGGTGGGGGGGGGNGGLDGNDKGWTNNRQEVNNAINNSSWTSNWEVGTCGQGGKGSANGDGGTGDGSGHGAFGLYNEQHGDFYCRFYTDDQSTGGSGGSNGTDLTTNPTKCIIASGAGANSHYGSKDIETLTPPVAYYTFTLNKNNGEGGDSEAHVVFGTSEGTQLNVPTRTGYNFLGYFTAASGGTKLYGADGNATNELRPFTNTAYLSLSSLYAQWKAIQYTIEYYTPDGKTKLTSQTVDYDTEFAFANHPASPSVPSGKQFAGWSPYLYGSAAIYYAGAKAGNLSSTQGEVLKFYAVYQDIPDHTVTYDANGGSGAPGPRRWGMTRSTPSAASSPPGKTTPSWAGAPIRGRRMQTIFQAI